MTNVNFKLLDQFNYLDVKSHAFDLWPIDPVPWQIRNGFNNLAQDEYLTSDFMYRFRGYGAGTLFQGKFNFTTEQAFYQSQNVNKLSGGVTRQFPELEGFTRSYLKTEILEQYYAKAVDPLKRYQIGIHQIRIFANETRMGLPAPEGVHQDGFDFVSLVIVSLDNVSGGKSLLLDPENHKKIVYEAYIPENSIFIFNDSNFSHYATPVTPKIPGTATRDIFVITLKEDTVFNEQI